MLTRAPPTFVTAQAEAYVKEMQDSGRYQRDVW